MKLLAKLGVCLILTMLCLDIAKADDYIVLVPVETGKKIVIQEVCLNGLAFAISYSGEGYGSQRSLQLVQIMVGTTSLYPKQCK